MGHLKSYLKKAKCIQEIISRHYEPGRQDRNLRSEEHTSELQSLV